MYGHKDTATEKFEEFDYGKNYLVAVGLDTLGRVNGKYSYTVYDNPDPAVDAAYEDFLGKWTVPLASGASSIWTITEKDYGKTYNITGIEGITEFSLSGEDAIVEGVYADGKFTVSVQRVGNEFTYNGNNCVYMLCGISSSGYSDDDVVITKVAKMPDGTLELRARNSFTAMRFLRINLSGSGAWYGSGNSTPLPNTATLAPFIAEYEDYLGFWEIPNGDAKDTWKITVKEEGSSYYVRGIAGWTDPVTATFNSSNGTMSIAVQPGLYETTSSYGAVSVGLRGYYLDGTTVKGVNGSYSIATFDYRGKNSCDVTTPTLTLSSGSEVTIVGFQWYANILEGSYAGYTLTYSNGTAPISSDVTLDKIEADVEEYNKWIGNWNVGDEVWQISEDLEGYTYTVTGIKGYNIPFSAEFNSNDKSFVLVEQEGVATAALNDTTTVSIALYGNFTYNEKSYYYGDGMDIASATLSGAGTATLTGCNISATYGDFSGFSVYGEDIERGDLYNFGSTTLPQSISAATSPTSIRPSSYGSRMPISRSYALRCAETFPILSKNQETAIETKAVKKQPDADKNVAIAE